VTYSRRKVGEISLAVGASLASPALAFGPTNANGGKTMEKVTGIGGFFFRANDPEALSLWYRDNLGIDLAPQKTGGAPWAQETGFTVFDPFAMESDMIPEGKAWMMNFRVSNLQAMIDQLRANGNDVPDLTDYPHGKFVDFADPEGNGIQLWQPPAG